MHQMRIASGDILINENGFSSLARKVQFMLEQLKENDKLYYFFRKLFSRQEMVYPSEDQYKYLHTLLDELLEILADSDMKDREIAVFQILMRYNFNHEKVRTFYLGEIDLYVVGNPGKETAFLKKVMSYCEELDRKDLGYNKLGHTLREEISHHTKLRLAQASNFKPFRLLISANTFYPLMGLLMKADVFADMQPAVAWDSLRHIFRDAKGDRFSLNTIKHRYRIDSESKLDELKEVLAKVSDLLEHHRTLKLRDKKL